MSYVRNCYYVVRSIQVWSEGARKKSSNKRVSVVTNYSREKQDFRVFFLELKCRTCEIVTMLSVKQIGGPFAIAPKSNLPVSTLKKNTHKKM